MEKVNMDKFAVESICCEIVLQQVWYYTVCKLCVETTSMLTLARALIVDIAYVGTLNMYMADTYVYCRELYLMPLSQRKASANNIKSLPRHCHP